MQFVPEFQVPAPQHPQTMDCGAPSELERAWVDTPSTAKLALPRSRPSTDAGDLGHPSALYGDLAGLESELYGLPAFGSTTKDAGSSACDHPACCHEDSCSRNGAFWWAQDEVWQPARVYSKLPPPPPPSPAWSKQVATEVETSSGNWSDDDLEVHYKNGRRDRVDSPPSSPEYHEDEMLDSWADLEQTRPIDDPLHSWIHAHSTARAPEPAAEKPRAFPDAARAGKPAMRKKGPVERTFVAQIQRKPKGAKAVQIRKRAAESQPSWKAPAIRKRSRANKGCADDQCSFCCAKESPDSVEAPTAEASEFNSDGSRRHRRRMKKPRLSRKMGIWWRKYGYSGKAYCQRCSEIFRDHIIRGLSNSCNCSRESPCLDCAKILEHFPLQREALWKVMGPGSLSSRK